MKIRDSLTLDASGLTLTKDGFLVGTARVSRAGNVQQYLGAELGLTDERRSQVFGVYRDPDVVFDEASMLSLAGRPVTRGHPRDSVTAANWKDLAVGQVGGVIKRDGEHVVAPMAIMDQAAAEEIVAGARALSAGYVVAITAADGVSPAGEPYQYRQSGELRFNHVAYLPDNNPRAGNTRIGDAAWREHFVEDKGELDASTQPDHPTGGPNVADTLRTVTVDSVPYNMNDQVAALVERMQGLLRDSGKALTDAQAAHKAGLDAKDAALAAKDAEIAELKGKVLDAAGMDKMVADRAAIMAKAKALAPTLDCAGKSNMDIKRAVLGDAAKDKSDAYVDAAWDLRNETSASKPLQDAIRNGLTVVTGDAAAVERAALTQANDDLNAWRSPAKAAV